MLGILKGMFDLIGGGVSALTRGLSDVFVIRLAAVGVFLWFCQPQLVELIQTVAGQGDGVLGLSQENWSRILYSLPVVIALFARSPGGIGIDDWMKEKITNDELGITTGKKSGGKES